jgi:hypothetical protein
MFAIAVSITGLCASLYERELYLNKVKNSIGNTIDFLQLIGMRLARFVIVCEAFYQHETLRRFFANLCEIDLQMRRVNAKVKFQSGRVKNFVILMCQIVFYLGMPMSALGITVIRGNYDMIAYCGSYILPLLTCCARYVQMSYCVWFIKERFETLNEMLAEIDINVVKDNSHIQSIGFMLYIEEFKSFKKAKPLKNFEKLIEMREMYGKLYNLTLLVNYSFGLSCVIMIANDFVSLTSNTYFIFISMTSDPFLFDHFLHVLQTFLWLLPHLVNFVVICGVCHLTMNVVSILDCE